MRVVVEVDDGFQVAFALEVAQEVSDFSLLVGESVHFGDEREGCTICHRTLEDLGGFEQVVFCFAGCIEVLATQFQELNPGGIINVCGDSDVAGG